MEIENKLAVYRLVEYPDVGGRFAERFKAPSDCDAVLRAYHAGDRGVIEIWRGNELVRRVYKAHSD